MPLVVALFEVVVWTVVASVPLQNAPQRTRNFEASATVFQFSPTTPTKSLAPDTRKIVNKFLIIQKLFNA